MACPTRKWGWWSCRHRECGKYLGILKDQIEPGFDQKRIDALEARKETCRCGTAARKEQQESHLEAELEQNAPRCQRT